MKKYILSLLLIINLANADFIRDDINNIIIDTNTNLMWQDNSDANSIQLSWLNAINYCENNVSLGGFNDWHLPNYNELYYLANRHKINPSINELFKYVSANNYWTSTTFSSNANYAWGVNFEDGHDYFGNDKTLTLYIRCVRLADN